MKQITENKTVQKKTGEC